MKRAVVFLLLACAPVAPAQSLLGPAPLSFRLQDISPRTATRHAVVLELHFRNTSQQSFRLMSAASGVSYEQGVSLLNLLTISLKQKGAAYIILAGPTKIDYGPGAVFQYVTILPGKSYRVVLPISKLLDAKAIPFPAGDYTVKMSYHNQAGEHCIKGVYPSNDLRLTVRR